MSVVAGVCMCLCLCVCVCVCVFSPGSFEVDTHGMGCEEPQGAVRSGGLPAGVI